MAKGNRVHRLKDRNLYAIGKWLYRLIVLEFDGLVVRIVYWLRSYLEVEVIVVQDQSMRIVVSIAALEFDMLVGEILCWLRLCLWI